MPTLQNAKHELFAQSRAKGKTQDEAYQLAGYKAHGSNAARMSQNDSIISRIAEIQTMAAKRTAVTVQSITDELEEARLAAAQAGQHSASVSASMGKAKLHGLLIEKKHISGGGGGPVKIDISGMSREQITSTIENLAHLASLADDTDQDDEGGTGPA